MMFVPETAMALFVIAWDVQQQITKAAADTTNLQVVFIVLPPINIPHFLMRPFLRAIITLIR
jgi:hypothetical protein